MTVPVGHRGERRPRRGAVPLPAPASRPQRPAVTVPRIAGLGPFTVRIWQLSPAAQGALALVIYLAAWIIGWTYPLLSHLHQTQLYQTSEDPNFYTWSLRWWPYALSHGLNPLFSNQIGAPAGFNLAWTTTVPPVALLAAPITALAGPVASLNLLTIAAPPLCGWLAFVVLRRLTGRFWAALLGGAIFSLSPYEIGHALNGQLNLTFNMLVPLMVYLVLLWRDGKLNRAWFVSLMALAMIVQFYVFLETYAELTVIWIAALLIAYALAGPGRPVVARLARQVGAAYLVALVVAGPYLWYALSHYPKAFSRSPSSAGFDLANLVVPRPNRAFGVNWLGTFSSHLPLSSGQGYVGIPLLVIFVALAVRTWSATLTRFLVIMFVVVLALAVGPDLVIGTLHFASVPWARLWYLPVARSALPYRFMMFGYLTLAAVIAVWVAKPVLGRWRQASRWLLALVAVAVVLADVPGPVLDPSPPNWPMASFITTGEYQHYLHRGEIVLVVSGRDNAAMLYQADTNFYMRVAGGYINMALTPNDLPPQAQALVHPSPAIEAQFLAYVRKAGIQAILVELAWKPAWAGVFDDMGFRGRAVGGFMLYQVGPA